MTQEYNVFISWSRDRSYTVAKALRAWLPKIIQTAKPWMSDTDIEKGSRSINEITKALQGIRVGIVCLTPENQAEPWLLFEAGALSKIITDEKTRLCTYLIGGLEKADVKQPLGMFQHTLSEKEETRGLVHTINKAVSDHPVSEQNLDDIFNAMWPEMEKAIAALPPAVSPVTSKRSAEDMIVEILELVRAEANARTNMFFAEPFFGNQPAHWVTSYDLANRPPLAGLMRYQPPTIDITSSHDTDEIPGGIDGAAAKDRPTEIAKPKGHRK